MLLQGATRFSSSLTEAANSLHGGIELQKPEQQYVDSIELKTAAFSRAANDETVLQHFNEVYHLRRHLCSVCTIFGAGECRHGYLDWCLWRAIWLVISCHHPLIGCWTLQVLAEWCKQTEALLAESGAGTASSLNDESGPDTELEFWRVRMAKFNSVTEQIKSKECRLVMGVCSTARSKQYKCWKEVDVKVTSLFALIACTQFTNTINSTLTTSSPAPPPACCFKASKQYCQMKRIAVCCRYFMSSTDVLIVPHCSKFLVLVCKFLLSLAYS